jgi:hypothetical protein
MEDEKELTGTCTYSPEDNKLRLYPFSRLDPDTYKRVKAAGFIWAPKQELFVAPMWTPGREDLLLELCEEIGDEDTSLVDRAEQRAERFEDYSEHRKEDADSAKPFRVWPTTGKTYRKEVSRRRERASMWR